MSVPESEQFDAQTDVVPARSPVVDAGTEAGRALGAPRLVCVTGVDAGQTFAVGTGVVIGRHGTDVALRSTDISRRHARVTVDDLGVVVEDLGSVNGTYLNGQRLSGPARARFGDRVQVGSTVFVLSKHDELEARMQRVQRLESMGTLAGGIAHDFNNTLMVILANLDELELALPEGARDARVALEEMRAAATASAGLARRLLRLGGTEHHAFEAVPLLALTRAAAAMMQRGLAAPIDVSLRIDPSLAVHGVQDDLHHLMLNLMINARDAMTDGGLLRIDARIVRVDAAGAPARDVAAAGDYIELVITDTGCGMDEATAARAFEPFFTTKGPERGTGLGLAMIHGIVRRHGGAIELRSSVGHGTTLTILLPRAVIGSSGDV